MTTWSEWQQGEYKQDVNHFHDEQEIYGKPVNPEEEKNGESGILT